MDVFVQHPLDDKEVCVEVGPSDTIREIQRVASEYLDLGESWVRYELVGPDGEVLNKNLFVKATGVGSGDVLTLQPTHALNARLELEHKGIAYDQERIAVYGRDTPSSETYRLMLIAGRKITDGELRTLMCKPDLLDLALDSLARDPDQHNNFVPPFTDLLYSSAYYPGTFKPLVAHGADIHAVPKTHPGRPVLQQYLDEACDGSQIEHICEMLRAGARISDKSNAVLREMFKRSFWRKQSRVAEVLPLLMARGMVMRKSDGGGALGLHHVVANGCIKTLDTLVQLMLEPGQHFGLTSFKTRTKVKKNVFHFSNKKATTEYLLRLKELDSGVSLEHLLLNKDAFGMTPLHRAVKRSSLDHVKLLVETCPGSLSIASQTGQTPLHYAAHLRRTSIWAFLSASMQANGVSLNSLDMNRHSSLHIAAHRGASSLFRHVTDPKYLNTLLDNGLDFGRNHAEVLATLSAAQQRKKVIGTIISLVKSDPCIP